MTGPLTDPSVHVDALASSNRTHQCGFRFPRTRQTWAKQRIQKLRIRGPTEGVATGPSIEPFLPDLADPLIKFTETAGICRTSVVLIVASKLPIESRLLLLNGIMPMRPAPIRHSLETAPEPLPHRTHMNREFPSQSSRTNMRESKKIESRRLRPTGLF